MASESDATLAALLEQSTQLHVQKRDLAEQKKVLDAQISELDDQILQMAMAQNKEQLPIMEDGKMTSTFVVRHQSKYQDLSRVNLEDRCIACLRWLTQSDPAATVPQPCDGVGMGIADWIWQNRKSEMVHRLEWVDKTEKPVDEKPIPLVVKKRKRATNGLEDLQRPRTLAQFHEHPIVQGWLHSA